MLTTSNKFTILRNISQGLGLRLILWFDTSSCRGTEDVKGVVCGGLELIDVAGQVAGCCECGNEPSSSIICGEFLD